MLLRAAAHTRWALFAIEGSIGRRFDAIARSRNDPMAVDRRAPGIQVTAGMVSRASAGPRQPGLALAGAWHARDPACRAYSRPSNEMSAPAHARSERISERLWHPFGEQVSPGSSLSPDCPRRRENRKLRTRGATGWTCRR